jgi:hypothetical protein
MDHAPIRVVVPGVLNFFFEQGRAILLCLANNWDPNSEVHSQLHWLERIEFQFVDNRVGVESGQPDLWPVGHSLCPAFAFMHHNWFHVLNAHVKFDAANCGRSVHVGPGCAKIANDDVVMETWSVLPALILENSMKKLKTAVCTEEKEFTITVEDKHVPRLHPEHASGWDVNDEHVLHNMFKVWKKEGKGQDPWLSTLKVCARKSNQAFFDHIDPLRFFKFGLELHPSTDDLQAIRSWRHSDTFRKHEGLNKITLVAFVNTRVPPMDHDSEVTDHDEDDENAASEDARECRKRNACRNTVLNEIAKICCMNDVDFVMNQPVVSSGFSLC